MSVKNYLLTFLTTACLFFSFAHEARASHAMGADIFYECVGRDSFLITVNFYRDCAGIAAPTSVSLAISGCNQTFSRTMTRTPLIQPEGIANGSEVSALCPSSINSSSCRGGNLPGVQQYQYSYLWVAPTQCANWRISFEENARNDLITTLQNPGSYDLYVEATINNTNGICNNSPRFTNRPVPYFCYQDSILYNHGTIDVDGDSLVYTLVQPMHGPGLVVPFANPYSLANPLNTNNTFTFDTKTGQMFFVPATAQNGVIAVRVDEYRNGVLIGSSMRDIQVVVLGSPYCVPPYGRINVNGIDSASVSGAVFTGAYNLEACPGDTVTFSIALGGFNITLGSNASQALPGATFDTTYINRDSVVGVFSWVTTGADTGIRNFSLNYGINSCPIDRTAFQTVTINILDGTFAGPDQIYCTAGRPVQLSVTGGNNFVWTPASSLNDDSIRNPLATPTTTTDYVVQSDLSAQCKNSDTVRVTVVPNFLLDILAADDTVDICRNSLVFLDVQTDSTYGPYSYSWSPGAGLSDSTAPNPVASPILPTNYVVEVTSDTGCVLYDTVRVNIVGVGPQVTVTPEEVLVCPGDTIQLNTVVLPVTCGPAISTGSCGGSPPLSRSIGTGTTSIAATPFSGGSSDGRYQVLYRATDLQAQGFVAGTIFRMQLNANKASNGVYKNMTIRMGCTDATQLNRADWIPTTTQVFFSANFQTAQGPNNITFQQFYDWDGVSNLVFEFCFGDSTFTNAGGNDLLVGTTVSYNASMGAANTTSNGGCNLPPSEIPLNQPTTQIPNLTLFICAANTPNYTYQWSPTAGLSNPNIADPVVVTFQPTVYTLTVSDSTCEGQDFATINLDTARVNISNDTALCNADSVQLFVNVTGVVTNPCGFNGTGCDGNRDTTIVGTGTLSNTSSTYPTPYSNFRESAKHQFLYTAAELLAAGVTPGRLTALGFNILNIPGSPVYRNFSIKVKCTSTTSLTQGTPEGGTFSTVFNPKNISLPPTGWSTHTFDSHYDWDGVSNLIFEVCFNNDTDPTQSTNITSNVRVLSTATAYTSSSWYPVDNADACSGAATPSNLQGASNSRPNIRLFTCTASPPYSVSWNPINSLDDPNSASPVAFPTTTTTYTVTVVTTTGCTKVDSVTVAVGSLPYSLTPDTTICNGGSAQLFVFGNPNYTYNWTTNTGTLNCTACPNPVATPDSTSVYYVTISDGNCTVTDSVVVTVFNLGGNVILDPGNVCVFDSLLLLAAGGYADYDWSNGDSTATTWIYAPGTYTLTITDANGCTAEDTIVVNAAAALPVSLGNDTSICVGDSIVLAIDDNYATYNWNVITTVDTGYTVLTTGVYGVSVTDANGCSSSDSILVFVNTVPVVNLGSDTAICDNQTLVLFAGSQPGYSYVWQDGSVSNSFTVDTTGTYYVTVSGGANCFDSDTITVTVNPAPDVNLGADIQSCAGEVVILRAGPGFDTYRWNNNTTRDSLVVTVTGTYSVTVADAIGCSDVDSITVTFNNPVVTLIGDTMVCEGETVTLDAGSFALYSWSTSETSRTITVDSTDTYSVTVTDAFNCTASDSVMVTVLAIPVVNITASADTICPGVLTTLDAGAGFTTYAWSPSGNTQTIGANAAGPYSVTVTNAAGCIDSDTIEIFEYPLATLTLEDLVLCPGDTVTYTAPAGYVTYSWSNSSQTAATSFTATGEYYLTVTNSQGCEAVDTLVVSDGGFTVEALVDPTQVDLGNSAGLTADVIGGTGSYSYNWTPSTYLDATDVENPTTTPDSTITYFVVVTDDSTGCVASDSVTITVFNEPRFSFTDAFSPNNGDNVNNEFYPLTYGNVQVTTFRIYNRWGELVHDDLTPWNGQVDGTDQPIGTYVYYAVINITTATGTVTETVQGSVTLLR